MDGKLVLHVVLILFGMAFVAPMPQIGRGGLCDCINPFLGTRNQYRGDPESLCGSGGPGFCYVAYGACRDQTPTASASRYQSRLARDALRGAILSWLYIKMPVCWGRYHIGLLLMPL